MRNLCLSRKINNDFCDWCNIPNGICECNFRILVTALRVSILGALLNNCLEVRDQLVEFIIFLQKYDFLLASKIG